MFAFTIPLFRRVIYFVCDLDAEGQLVLITFENLTNAEAAERVMYNRINNVRHFCFTDCHRLS